MSPAYEARILAFLFISLVLASLRIGGVTHEAFQAAAHLFVGYLLCGWFERRDAWYAGIAIGLSVVEVSVAMVDHWGQITALCSRFFGG